MTAETETAPKPPQQKKKAYDISNVPPALRAAIVIALLGEDAAKPILEKLNDDSLTRVKSALEQVSLLPRDLMMAVIGNFLGQLKGGSAHLLGGRNTAKEMITGIFASRVEPDSDGGLPMLDDAFEPLPFQLNLGVQTEDVWTRLAARPAEKIAAYVGPMTPNLIAMIVRKLPNDVASEVLGRIDGDKLQPVLENLVTVNDSDVDMALEDILGRSVEIEFLNGAGGADGENSARYEALGEILSLIPAAKRDPLVSFLEKEHEEQLKAIQKALFSIEDLPEILPAEAVPVIFRQSEKDEMVKTLASIKTDYMETYEFLLGNISSRMAQQYKDDLDSMMAPSDAEQEELQRKFISDLFSMKRDGMITVKPRKESAA